MQGDVEAQNNLGVMYDQGHGTIKDYQEALKWYRLSAAQGNATAQNNLGVKHGKDEGVTRSDQEALR